MPDASGDAGSVFAERLTAAANAECESLCETIMTKARAGERWAVELVVRNVFARPVEGEDTFQTLLEDIRERTARSS